MALGASVAATVGGEARTARTLYDPGPTPRDPAGPHAALYQKMRGKFSYSWGCLVHIIGLVSVVAGAAATESYFVGGALIAIWWGAARVKRAFEAHVDAGLPADVLPGARLFIHGRYAVAEVTERKQVESGFKLAYRFDADGTTVTGELATPVLKGIANPPGTRFGVLWSGDRPETHHKLEEDLASGE